MSGAIFGDNLAPISDTTIASASTQQFKNGKPADIGGVVSSRIKYSAVAGLITIVIFAVFGGMGGVYEGGSIDAAANPVSLVMLIPVVLMLTVSTKTRNIYEGILVGLVTGTVVGLAAGLFTPAQVFSNDAANNAAVGFLIDGINNILPTCALVISVFGIMGVLSDAGMLNLIAEKILNSRMASTTHGAELICMMGIAFTTILLGGVTSASILTFGPILNKIGAARNIHPYRRANLLDGTANSLPAIIPFMSVFVFIGSALTGLSPVVVAGGTIYGFVLFAVFLGAVLTGWGCQKEELKGADRMDDTFTLYDLKVEVVATDRPMVCSHRAGDYFLVQGENLVFPKDTSFSMYSLSALIPLLPAKQRPLDPNDWMLSDIEIACPDPNCGARFKITRVGKRIQSHGQCTVVPIQRPERENKI